MTAAADSATPNPVTLLEQTTARTKMVMAGVRQSQIDAPTPCAEWNVHGLVNHLIGGLEFTAACIAGVPTAIRPSEAESSQINERVVGSLAQAITTGWLVCWSWQQNPARWNGRRRPHSAKCRSARFSSAR